MLFHAVSRCYLSLYSTSQLCMHCLTDLIIFISVLESIFKNPQSALLYCYFRQSLKAEYPASYFLPPFRVQNRWTPHCPRLWSLPKMNVSLCAIWATLHCKSSSTRGGLHWMTARSGLLLGIILDMNLGSDSIYTAELGRPAALASFVSFVIKFFANHQNMGPAHWGNTCWKRLTLQSWTN